MPAAVVFHTALAGFPGVTRRIAVRGWADDHLYSFWRGPRAFDTDATEHTAPYDLEPGMTSAEVSLESLRLSPDDELTYVFDFGDHWEVALRVLGSEPAEDGA